LGGVAVFAFAAVFGAAGLAARVALAFAAGFGRDVFSAIGGLLSGIGRHARRSRVFDV
jgi:hypothetical protein